jgi:hypothetical protein
MLKDLPKESASKVAERKWRNHALTQRYLEKRQEAKEASPRDADTEIRMAEAITNDHKLHGPVKRLESKFKKELKSLMQDHATRNLLLYSAYLQRRKNRLLREKLRRLEAVVIVMA